MFKKLGSNICKSAVIGAGIAAGLGLGFLEEAGTTMLEAFIDNMF